MVRATVIKAKNDNTPENKFGCLHATKYRDLLLSGVNE